MKLLLTDVARVLVPEQILLVFLAAEAHGTRATALVRQRQQEGKRVLYLCANRPHRNMEQMMQAAGLDPLQVEFLDIVTGLNGVLPEPWPPNVRYIRSPTMLEMIAMQTEKAASRGRTHVILDSLNALAIYNGPQPVQEFSHFLANRLRTLGAGADLLVTDNDAGRGLADLLAGFLDGTMRYPEVP